MTSRSRVIQKPSLSLSRRSLIKGALAGAGVLSLSSCAMGPPLGAPLIEPKDATLNDDGQVEIIANDDPFTLDRHRVALRHYNDQPFGPTIRVRGGQQLKLELTNKMLPDPFDYTCLDNPPDGVVPNTPHGFNTTNMHVHGLHVSPNAPSDDILLKIASGQSFNYVYDLPKTHPTGTFFYHAHFHGSVALQLAGGMAGPLIVEGALDDIPAIKACRQRILMLQTPRYDAQGRCDDYAILANNGPTMVNGQRTPVISIRPGEVQFWRMINASFSSFYTLQVAQHMLVGLGYDGNPMPFTQTADTVRLAPGNRADMLIKGGAPGLYALTGMNAQDLLAWVRVEGPPMDMELFQGALPTQAELLPIPESEVTFGRRLTFGMTGAPEHQTFTINNIPFSCDDPWEIPLGAVEEWEITNQTADIHPFHIHVNPFQMVSGGGQPPGRWLDTVEVPPYDRVTFRTRFTDFKGLFVFHCHVLTHEDLGMMQAVKVI
jgi:FtsP/CotA-like multicopper oxidase with cupredoxin domain